MHIAAAFTGLIVLVFLVIKTAAALIYLFSRRSFWLQEGKKVSTTSGYVTPYISWASRLALYLITRTYGRLYLGGLQVKGAEKLYKSPTRLIVCPNHQFEHDAIVLSYLVGTRRWRFLAAIEQLAGWRAPWMAWLGIVPVDHNNLRARVKVIGTIVDTLKRESGTSFIIFPQGRLVADNQLLLSDFNTGPAIMATRASAECGEPFSLLPVYIEYKSEEKEAKAWHRVLAKLGISRQFCGRSMYGCTVTIGDAIAAAPEADKQELTDRLFQAIVKLQSA